MRLARSRRPRRYLSRALVCALLAFPGTTARAQVPADQPSAHARAQELGQRAADQGDFVNAVRAWTEAAGLAAETGRIGDRVTALVELARAHRGLGRYRSAQAVIRTAVSEARATADPHLLSWALGQAAEVELDLGALSAAESLLGQALQGQDEGHEPSSVRITAGLLGTLGNLRREGRRFEEAVLLYRRSLGLLGLEGAPLLRATLETNLALSLKDLGRGVEARAALDVARQTFLRLPPGQPAAHGLLTVAVGYRDLRPLLDDHRDALTLVAAQVLEETARRAERLGDARTAAGALGYLGGLYEEERRFDEALRLTRRAVLLAQQTGVPEALYRWQWQTARLLRGLGRGEEAVDAYRRTVGTLQSIRPELAARAVGVDSFREGPGRVYFELVDLLLSPGVASGNPAAPPEPMENRLREARDIVELFKVAELHDYFRDDCVELARSQEQNLDVLAHQATVVYLVLLPDRTELLVSLPGQLQRVTVPVTLARLTDEVRQFRQKLEKRTTRQYLPHARQLYDWLIRPLHAILERGHTSSLVFVADGPLRTIPLGALHDGTRFLASKWPLGTTPGLRLTDPRPLDRSNVRVLALGVGESVQGFPALPNVPLELESVGQTFRTTELLDRDFVMNRMEEKLKGESFPIVHIASHGQFAGQAAESFVLTYNEKLTMDRLEALVGRLRFRREPLELLTLSACESAAGDDRAALGLAGIAIKAGARSALATLWRVDDEATAQLVGEFYRQLQSSGVSRAQALQRAQEKLMANPRFDHPGFWAPFLLINNWL